MSSITIEFFFQRWGQSLFRWGITIIPLFLILSVIRPRFLDRFKIPQFNSSPPKYFSEFIRSVLVFLVYTIPTYVLIFVKAKTGYSMMYTDINQYGHLYFVFSIFIFFIVLDTLTFWTHYGQHKIKILKSTHVLHHKSITVNPLTTYSVNFREVFLNMLPILIVLLTIPWHPLAYISFATIAVLNGGYLHSGYDLTFGKTKPKRFFGWYYSPTHHSLHHQKYECNYGLYFTFWDKFMGTEDLTFDKKAPGPSV